MTDLARRIERASEAYNADHHVRASVAVLVGVISTGVQFALVYVLVWVFTQHLNATVLGLSPAVFCALLSLGAGLLAALVFGDPYDGLDPLTEAQQTRVIHQARFPGGRGTVETAHVGAGMLDLIGHGPRCVRRGLDIWRSTLPSSDASARAAADALRAIGGPARAQDITPASAFVHLRRLRLIRAQRRGDGAPVLYEITDKARAWMSGADPTEC